MLKAADATKKHKAPFWLLMDGVLTYARHAEKDAQTGHPALLDEFYKIFSNLWEFIPAIALLSFFSKIQ